MENYVSTEHEQEQVTNSIAVVENGEDTKTEDSNLEQNQTQRVQQTNAVAPNINYIHDDVKNRVEQHATSLGLSNVNVDVAPGTNLGDNFMGFIGKLTITGTDKNGKQKTLHWVIKTAPDNELYRMILNVARLYAREAYVYEEVFPLFKRFQSEKLLLKPFNEHPKLVLTHMESTMESIVMEDLKTVGYIMRNRQEPLDLNHVKLVMKAYGKLHAISYALKDQNPEEFEILAANTPDQIMFNEITKKEDVYTNQRPLMDNALEAMDSVKDAKAIVKFKQFAERFVDIVQDKLKDTNEYSIISHGDSWVNNILWIYEDPRKPTVPTNVCILDWQICRYGSPAFDLSYFFFTCTTKELRDKHYDDLVRLYYYTLCSNLIELGSDPEKLFPYDALQQELKKYSVVGFYFSICVLYIITRETSEMPEWRSNDMDAEELGKKWIEKSVNIDKYNCRVRGAIVDAFEKGYFDFLG